MYKRYRNRLSKPFISVEVDVGYGSLRTSNESGAISRETSGSETESFTPCGCYLRSKPELSPRDRKELDDYFRLLRRRYNIPDDQPVFPPVQRVEGRRTRPSAQKPSRGAKNAAGHPWRHS